MVALVVIAAVVLPRQGLGVFSTLKPGAHVVLSFNSCDTCPSCSDAKPAYCFNYMANNFSGVRPNDGSTPLSQDGAVVFGPFDQQRVKRGIKRVRPCHRCFKVIRHHAVRCKAEEK